MTGSYEAAMEAYEALTGDPKTAVRAALGLAETRMSMGRYQEAIEGLSGLDPSALKPADLAERHYLLAQLYLRIGRYDDTQASARAALKALERHAGARRLLGEILEMLGKREEAVEVYRWFDRQMVERRDLPRDAAWLTDAGVGFLRYSVLTGTDVPRRTQHVLNEMLQLAYERIDRSYWPGRIAAAGLLRDKFNNSEESGSVSDYMAALKINENLPEAHIGLGEVALLGWGFEEAEHRAEAALKVNPNFAPAFHLLAKKFLVERRYQQAAETCERALTVNPNDLVALSLTAAACACRYDQEGVERIKSRVAVINPKYALLHSVLGDALSGIRQYSASETEYQQAIAFDPTDANSRAEMGMMYMQWGLEDKARDALDTAWALDAYNERTKFTLELLDKLHKFAKYETEHFIIRYDGERDPGLGEYVANYLESIYQTVTGDFETPLAEKTIIEFFPTQRAFGVRVTGKPWIHTVGASTGRVIALATPREAAGLLGRYNLARVLKHEFTHTVTLAATENRIPHWLTEGLAVFQEDAPRMFEWNELLADSLRRDQLFTLESIDWGFMRPRRGSDRQLAYAQSEWMVEYIVERFGYDTITAMLKRYRAGQTQSQVLAEQLKIEPEEFDREFRKWAGAQLSKWGCRFDLTPPEDLSELRKLAAGDDPPASVFGRLARAEYDADNYDRALAAARRALELDENDRSGLLIFVNVLALLSREERTDASRRLREDEALPAIERLMQVDPAGRTAPKQLGQIALRRNEWDQAAEAFRRLQRVCPLDPASWRGLAAVHMEKKQYELALPQLIELARIEQNDPTVPQQVAEIVRRRGELREAQHWYRQALFIDPFEVGLHKALGDTSLQAGDSEAALREYRMLTYLEPKEPRHFESGALAAQKLGDEEAVQKFARRAVELDPNSPARTLIRQ